MKIRIRRGCIEETLLLVLFGFYVLIAHWIWFGRGIQETAMIVLSILVLLKSAKIRQISVNTLPDYILVGILLVVCGIGFFQMQESRTISCGRFEVNAGNGNCFNGGYCIHKKTNR